MKARSCTSHHRNLPSHWQNVEDTEPPNGANQGDTDPGKYAHQRKYRIEDSKDSQTEPLGSDTNLS